MYIHIHVQHLTTLEGTAGGTPPGDVVLVAALGALGSLYQLALVS